MFLRSRRPPLRHRFSVENETSEWRTQTSLLTVFVHSPLSSSTPKQSHTGKLPWQLPVAPNCQHFKQFYVLMKLSILFHFTDINMFDSVFGVTGRGAIKNLNNPIHGSLKVYRPRSRWSVPQIVLHPGGALKTQQYNHHVLSEGGRGFLIFGAFWWPTLYFFWWFFLPPICTLSIHFRRAKNKNSLFFFGKIKSCSFIEFTFMSRICTWLL